ncbi:MAG: ComF family protein [Planctomycetes bacterium]|nr:ComF family protein [Planctomycetota bacterium]
MDAVPRAWIDELLGAIYPPACWVCGGWAADAFACTEHRLIRPPPAARCGRCALRLPRGVPDGERCLECRRAAPAFACTFVWGDWGPGPLREWVLAFKHGGRRDLAAPLASALVQALARARDGSLGGLLAGLLAGARDGAPSTFDVLVPVPLHPWRRLSRGYDQAHLLAKEVGRSLGLPTRRWLVRRRATPPQGGPGSASRAANVRDAFRAAWLSRRSIADARILLVDDVVTSGATVRECARVLRAAGAARVAVLALARASHGHAEPDASDETGALVPRPMPFGSASSANRDFDPPPE